MIRVRPLALTMILLAANLAGSWITTTSIWMSGPGSEPMVTEGTSEKSWVLGGRWLEERYQGTMMGRPLEGRGMTGFDNYKVFEIVYERAQ